jgi:succinate dehydrogenase / fumarate reductase cytochrome b subunit
MTWFVAYVRSSVGAKHIMAVTGILLVLFAIFHMIGHWGMFAGRDAYNTYATTLQGLGAFKWLARGGLLFLLIVHVVSGLRLAALNRAARPVGYRVFRPARTRIWSRTMALTGLAVLAFLIYHILHFTVGSIQPDYFHLRDPANKIDAYVMYVRGFQHPWILASYLVGMTLLLPHLMHGISSLFQSLGLRHPKYDGLIDKSGPALALILYLGYIIPPIAVASGYLQLPGA